MTSGLPWRELGSVEQDYNTGASHITSALLTETRQVVPADWIREMTTTRWSTNDAMTDRDAGTGLDYYFATGYGGQFVVNVPAAKATIVATTAWSGVSNAGANWSLVMGTIVETVLPGLR
jgi:CubicO group peptidase (beta-lactamase class C family)